MALFGKLLTSLGRRPPNTKRDGTAWTERQIAQVWEKGTTDVNLNPAKFRRDFCGATMQFDAFGDRFHQKGWVIDHIKPVAAGGGDEFSNLQPLHCRNNNAKGDSVGPWNCELLT